MDSVSGGVAVVFNPIKVDDLDELKSDIGLALREHGYSEPTWLETTESDPGEGQTAAAVKQGASLVLACGGDGTVSACASALAGTGVSLGLVPLGTGNLLARNLDVPLDRAEALKVALGDGRRLIDLIENEDGKRVVIMSGLGLDAAMVRDTSDELKAKVGWPAYIGGVARALRRSPRTRFTITTDLGAPQQHVGVGVLVGNVGRLQAGLAVLPDAVPDDGLADLVLFAPRSWRDWPRIAWNVLTRKAHDGHAHTVVARGAELRIEASRSLPVEFDGELCGQARSLSLKVLPTVLKVCVRHD